jgi:hypothetical protein
MHSPTPPTRTSPDWTTSNKAGAPGPAAKRISPNKLVGTLAVLMLVWFASILYFFTPVPRARISIYDMPIFKNANATNFLRNIEAAKNKAGQVIQDAKNK